MTGEQFEELMRKIPKSVSRAILFLPLEIREEICEIRLRKDRPTALTLIGKTVFLCGFGGISEKPGDMSVTVSGEQLDECFLALCNRSVFAHFDEIKEGYLAVGYGCRAGISGRFTDEKAIDVTSVNIRISHDVRNCAGSIMPYVSGGLLIAGPPSSGKTTLLRDIARQLSSGYSGRYKRVCVVDSREEITVGYDPGICCDSLIIKDKSKGIEIALRTLSPEVIVFDEIGTKSELVCVSDCLNSGVDTVTTAHAGSLNELKKRNVIRELLESGAVGHVALLSEIPGKKPRIFKTEEILYESD